MSEPAKPEQWYLVINTDGRYLARKPYDGSWDYYSPTQRYATPLTEAMARYFAKFYNGRVIPDSNYVNRKPYRPNSKADAPILAVEGR